MRRKNWIKHGFEDILKDLKSKGLETCHFEFSKHN
jgi:hypothetical protein